MYNWPSVINLCIFKVVRTENNIIPFPVIIVLGPGVVSCL